MQNRRNRIVLLDQQGQDRNRGEVVQGVKRYRSEKIACPFVQDAGQDAEEEVDRGGPQRRVRS